MHTQLAGAPVPLLWAQALEAVHLVHAGASRGTGAGGTFINVCVGGRGGYRFQSHPVEDMPMATPPDIIVPSLPVGAGCCSPSAQVGPLQPDGQWHSKPEGTSWQEPPLAQGFDVQACSAAPGGGRGKDHVPSTVPGHTPQVWTPTPLTVLARVAIGAGTVVLVRLSVNAGAPVDAGMMAAAVVQVWGQENTLGGGPRCPIQP